MLVLLYSLWYVWSMIHGALKTAEGRLDLIALELARLAAQLAPATFLRAPPHMPLKPAVQMKAMRQAVGIGAAVLVEPPGHVYAHGC